MTIILTQSGNFEKLATHAPELYEQVKNRETYGKLILERTGGKIAVYKPMRHGHKLCLGYLDKTETGQLLATMHAGGVKWKTQKQNWNNGNPIITAQPEHITLYFYKGGMAICANPVEKTWAGNFYTTCKHPRLALANYAMAA